MTNRRHGLALTTFVTFAIASQLALGQIRPRPVKDPNVIEEFEFNIGRERLILVPVKLGEKTYPFAVDTGSSHLVFDSSLKSYLGPVRQTASIKTPSGTTEAELFDAPRAFLGSLDLQTPDVVCCSDLTPIRKAIGSEIYGLIGMSFLKNHVVRVDFEKAKVAFLKQADPQSGKATLFSIRGSIPLLELEIPRLGKRQFLVDTGYNLSMSLDTQSFAELLVETQIKYEGRTDHTHLDKIVNSKKGTLKRVSLNGIELREVPVVECVTPRTRVGLRFLGKFQCTFDFPNSTLYLRENGRPTDPRR